MRAPFFGQNGASFSHDVSVCVIRWGGGTEHGKYHVFVMGAGYGFFGSLSRHCVVDDFGNLVPVDGSES